MGQPSDEMIQLLRRIAASLEKLELNMVPDGVAQAYEEMGGDVWAVRRGRPGPTGGGRWR